MLGLAIAALVAVIVVLGVMIGRGGAFDEEEVESAMLSTLQSEASEEFLVTGRLTSSLSGSSARRWRIKLLNVETGRAEVGVRVPATMTYGFSLADLAPGDLDFQEGGVVEVRLPPLAVFSVEPELERADVDIDLSGQARLTPSLTERTLEQTLRRVRPALRAQAEDHLRTSDQPAINTARTLSRMLATPARSGRRRRRRRPVPVRRRARRHARRLGRRPAPDGPRRGGAVRWPWSRPAREAPAYVDTPAGLVSADGTRFRTTEPLLREYAGAVLDAVGLDVLVRRTGVWLRSPQTLAVWVLPALLAVVPWWFALALALALYTSWTVAAPGLALPGLARVAAVLEHPVLQGLVYVGVLSAFAAAGAFAALWTGIAGVRRPSGSGSSPPPSRPALAGVLDALYPLPPADQTLRAFIIREGLRRGVTLPGVGEVRAPRPQLLGAGRGVGMGDARSARSGWRDAQR